MGWYDSETDKVYCASCGNEIPYCKCSSFDSKMTYDEWLRKEDKEVDDRK